MNWDMVRAFLRSSDKGTRLAAEKRIIEEMEKLFHESVKDS